MSKDTDKSFFIVSSVPRLYQHLLKGLSSHQRMAETVLSDIKIAYDFRHIERVRELSRILIHIPIKEYQVIGEYYLIWCECRESRLHTESLERIIGQTQTYKAQALLSRGTFEVYKGKLEVALYFYLEGLKASHSISDHIGLSLAIAQLKGIEGFHASSLGDLENLIPIIRHAEPRLYYDFLNSYAVELAEAGGKQEARNISRILLASPFAPAYPAWQETGRELGIIDCKEPRSYVLLKALPEPTVKPQTKVQRIKKAKPKSEPQTASVIAFPTLKEAPQPQKPDRITPQEWSELNMNQKRELVLTALRTGTFTPFDYDRFMVMVGLLDSGPAEKVLDLEDEETISDIAVVWANQVEPARFAAVLSALRDCEDTKRRNGIIDRMIRIAFEETQLCGLTEEAWRFQVERRLPKK
jgi:hypothetical protein